MATHKTVAILQRAELIIECMDPIKFPCTLQLIKDLAICVTQYALVCGDISPMDIKDER